MGEVRLLRSSANGLGVNKRSQVDVANVCESQCSRLISSTVRNITTV